MTSSAGDIEAATEAIVRSMRADLPQLARDLARFCLDRVAELPDDPEAVEALAASAAGHLETVLELLDPDGERSRDGADPAAAVAYTELMARRGVAAEAVMQANRLGLTWFWQTWRERIDRTATAEPHRAELIEAGLEPVIAYSGAAGARISAPHAQERARWLRSPEAIRAEEVRQLLLADPTDPDATGGRLGYRLAARHLAIVAWPAPGSGGADTAQALGELLAATPTAVGPLVVDVEPGETWAWVSPEGPAGSDDEPAARMSAAARRSGLLLAIGDPARDVHGFRLSHRDAREAARVARHQRDPSPVTRFRDVAVLALLTADRERARLLASTVLGELAAEGDRAALLRRALLAYLDGGSSFAAAGRALGAHANTVAYRVRRAEETLPRPIGERRFELEAALRIAELEPAAAEPERERIS